MKKIVLLLFSVVLFSCTLPTNDGTEKDIPEKKTDGLFQSLTEPKQLLQAADRDTIEFDNIAVGKNAVVSSEFSVQYSGYKAVDGLPDTFWASDAAGDSQWIYVDLGQITSIMGIGINWFEIYYAKTYEIFISRDGQTWTPVYKRLNGTGGFERLFGNVDTRFIAILATEKNAAAYGLNEFEVYVHPTTPTPPPGKDFDNYTILQSDINPYSSWGYSNADVSGNYLYVVASNLGLLIFDNINPAAPVLVAKCQLPDTNIRSVVVKGSYAYVGSSEQNLYVVDISDAHNPTIVTGINVGDDCDNLILRDNYLYFAANGLHIIDITDPIAPVIVGSLSFSGSGYNVAIEGNYAFVKDRVLDISDVTQLVEVTAPGLPSSWVFDVQGNYYYALYWDQSTYNGFMEIWDISTITAPVLISGIQFPEDYFSDIEVRGDYAYISDENDLLIYNIADKAAPRLVKEVDAPMWTDSLNVFEPYVYSYNGQGGFTIFDISQPENAFIVDMIYYAGPESSTKVLLSGNNAFISSGIIQIADTQVPADSAIVDTVHIKENYSGIQQGVGNRLYASGYYFYELDTTNVDSIVVDASYDINGYCFDEFVVAHPYVYGAASNKGVVIYNLETQAITAHIDTITNANGVFLKDTYLFVAYEEGVNIYDVQDPVQPFLVKTIVFNTTTGYNMGQRVYVDNDILYVLIDQTGLYCVDISNIYEPVIGDFIGTLAPRDFHFTGRYCYVADSQAGVQVIDLYTKALVKTIKTIDSAVDIVEKNDIIYVADNNAGLIVIGEK